MARPTVTIQISCAKCQKMFTLRRWEHRQRQLRGKRLYCSAYCKNHRLGILASNWKGGRRAYPSKQGYIMVSLGSGQRAPEHRLVMEQRLGRKLLKGEVVHHVNGNPADNRVENLVVCKSAGQHHARYHQRKRKGNGQFLKSKDGENCV